MPSFNTILPLLPVVQQYAWGLSGDSYVKRFSALGSAPLGNFLDMAGPMAEAWAACHPNGVSKVRIGNNDISLQQLIDEHSKDLLGEETSELMILGKVLSVGQPLSIQNHPNAEAAKQLNAKFPDLYDPNPKPEASIALSEVQLLYGFRPESEILEFIHSVKALGSFFTPEQRKELQDLERSAERAGFLSLICSIVLDGEKSPAKETTEAQSLCQKLYSELEAKSDLNPEEQWILNLKEHYPNGDVGCFFFYLLNLVTLKPGECQFIATGIPHAYLRGEMLEFMFNSDNTLRAGLTLKAKDIETLLSITDFASNSSGIIKAQAGANGSLSFAFPKEANFAVSVMQGSGTYHCKTSGLEVLIAPDALGTIGEDVSITPASMWLVPAAIGSYEAHVKKGNLYRLCSA